MRGVFSSIFGRKVLEEQHALLVVLAGLDLLEAGSGGLHLGDDGAGLGPARRFAHLLEAVDRFGLFFDLGHLRLVLDDQPGDGVFVLLDQLLLVLDDLVVGGVDDVGAGGQRGAGGVDPAGDQVTQRSEK